MLISWIIPAFNEADIIGKTIAETIKMAGNNPIEIIVSDDGSSDETVDISQKFESVRIIRNQHKGRGGAILNALRQVNGDIIVLSSADIVLEKDYFEKLLEKMKNADLLLLSKGLRESRIVGRTMLRAFLSNNFNSISTRLFGLQFKDTQGVKFLKKKLVEPILTCCSDEGFLLDLEIVIMAKRNGFSIEEVPWVLVDRANSRMLINLHKFILGLIRIWLRDRDGYYNSNLR